MTASSHILTKLPAVYGAKQRKMMQPLKILQFRKKQNPHVILSKERKVFENCSITPTSSQSCLLRCYGKTERKKFQHSSLI